MMSPEPSVQQTTETGEMIGGWSRYVQSGMHYMDRLYDHNAPGLSELQRKVCTMPVVWHNISRHPRSPYTQQESQATPTTAKM